MLQIKDELVASGLGDDDLAEINFAVCLSSSSDKLFKLFKEMRISFASAPKAALRFLLNLTEKKSTQGTRMWKYLLLACPAQEVRQEFAKLLAAALASSAAFDRKMVEEQGLDSMEPSSAPFVAHLMSRVEKVRKFWRTHSSFWWLVKRCTACGYNERKYLVENDTISLWIDYYMGPYSPYWEGKDVNDRVRIGDRNTSPDLTSFMKALANLLCVSSNEANARSVSCLPEDKELVPMTAKTRAILYNRDFFVSLLRQAYSLKANERVLTHLSWESRDRTLWFLSVIMQHIYVPKVDHLDNLIRGLEGLMAIRDSLRPWRVRLALNYENNGLLYRLWKSRERSNLLTIAVANLVLKLLQSDPVAAGFLHSSKKKWAWLEEQVSNYPQWPDVIAFPSAAEEFALMHKRLREFLYVGGIRGDEKATETKDESKGKDAADDEAVEAMVVATADEGNERKVSVGDDDAGGGTKKVEAEEKRDEEAPTPAEEEWACLACTFLNPMRRRRCEMCDSPRLRPLPQTGSQPESPTTPAESSASVFDYSQTLPEFMDNNNENNENDATPQATDAGSSSSSASTSATAMTGFDNGEVPTEGSVNTEERSVWYDRYREWEEDWVCLGCAAVNVYRVLKCIRCGHARQLSAEGMLILDEGALEGRHWNESPEVEMAWSDEFEEEWKCLPAKFKGIIVPQLQQPQPQRQGN